MKLIIDIPEEFTKKDHFYTEKERWSIVDAVQNGTPLDKIIADLESLREPTEPHLVDYRYHRNDMLDIVLGVIERYRNEARS